MKQSFFVCSVAVVISAVTLSSQYSLTVNKDRLINAQNEPQNWLLMNGDYGSLRYSKLTQINRDNVKDLRVVWALALGGMQDVGQNGPENEVNPLVDNGFMYTTDGWGTVYKIDARYGTNEEYKQLAAEMHKRDLKLVMDYVTNHWEQNIGCSKICRLMIGSISFRVMRKAIIV